jgi:hypothetical protein
VGHLLVINKNDNRKRQMDKSKITVRPIELKGREAHDRMIELMGVTPIRENITHSAVELTKKGPDGKIYGIVRENHEWYIKIADGENLTKEGFQYIGGLANKKDFAYPSYAKAIKQLNQKFQSLNEALGVKGNINVFRNDNLLNEAAANAQKFAQDKKGKSLESDAPEGTEGGVFGDNLVGKNGKKKAERDWTKVKDSDMVDMTEDEKKIDAMISGEEYDGEVVEESMLGAASFFQGDDIILNMNNTLSISRGVDRLGEAIANATGEKKDRDISEATKILSKLSKAEVIAILESVTGKKKI